MNILPLICLAATVISQVGANPSATAPSADAWQLASESQKHMGTEFTIQVYHRKGSDAQPAMKAAFARIEALDRMMTDYDPESELSRLSASSPHGQPVAVSEDLYRILRQASDASERSGGAFDVTVGPLTKLWRQARRQKKIPDPEKLKAALAAVGWKNMRLSMGERDKQYFVQLTKPNMRLDLGGIAQGYAAEHAFEVLVKSGFERAMVNASGDIRVGLPPPGKPGWKIALTGLKPKEEKVSEFVILRSPCAISTSGDAFQYVEFEGKRYSHIVDPKTGMGLTTPMSVTVIGPNATLVDAYASALCVMGPDQAKEQAKRWNAEGFFDALFVVKQGEEVRKIELSNFRQFYEVAAPAE